MQPQTAPQRKDFQNWTSYYEAEKWFRVGAESVRAAKKPITSSPCGPKVWLSPCPGVAFPGFKLSQWHGWCRYLYRDLDGRCRKITLWRPGEEDVFER